MRLKTDLSLARKLKGKTITNAIFIDGSLMLYFGRESKLCVDCQKLGPNSTYDYELTVDLEPLKSGEMLEVQR